MQKKQVFRSFDVKTRIRQRRKDDGTDSLCRPVSYHDFRWDPNRSGHRRKALLNEYRIQDAVCYVKCITSLRNVFFRYTEHISWIISSCKTLDEITFVRHDHGTFTAC